jgi:hypothetical protein
MYLLLIMGLWWRLVSCIGWLWIIIWILVTTIGCSWVIITIFSIVSSCGTWIGTVSSCSILIAVACSARVILKQLHGLLLGVNVHPASFVVAIVVVIIILDLHELG